MTNANDEKAALSGSVEDITYRNEDNGFTVLTLSVEGEPHVVVGILPDVAVGEQLSVVGTWDHHATFGRQLRVETFERKLPSTAADLLHYLSGGAIKGVGPATAVKIVEAFGEDAFDVLENSPKRLARIKGISFAKAMEICQRFREQFAVREVMMALEKIGLTASECMRAYKAFDVHTLEAVRENPYCLCAESIGISFERVDAMASALTDSPDSLLRAMAGVEHAVRYNLRNGHTCLPREKLFAPCRALLQTDDRQIDEAMRALVQVGRLIETELDGKAFLFLPRLYEAEKSAADHMRMKLRFPPAGHSTLSEEIRMAELHEGVQ